MILRTFVLSPFLTKDLSEPPFLTKDLSEPPIWATEPQSSKQLENFTGIMFAAKIVVAVSPLGLIFASFLPNVIAASRKQSAQTTQLTNELFSDWQVRLVVRTIFCLLIARCPRVQTSIVVRLGVLLHRKTRLHPARAGGTRSRRLARLSRLRNDRIDCGTGRHQPVPAII
jgi:hypothetical protein